MQCDVCHSELSSTARFCVICGAAREPAPATQATETSTCPHCAASLKPGARFCNHCGKSTTAATPAPSFTEDLPAPKSVPEPTPLITPAEPQQEPDVEPEPVADSPVAPPEAPLRASPLHTEDDAARKPRMWPWVLGAIVLICAAGAGAWKFFLHTPAAEMTDASVTQGVPAEPPPARQTDPGSVQPPSPVLAVPAPAPAPASAPVVQPSTGQTAEKVERADTPAPLAPEPVKATAAETRKAAPAPRKTARPAPAAEKSADEKYIEQMNRQLERQLRDLQNP